MDKFRPWGQLTGVRPTKIAHRRLDVGDSAEVITCWLQDRYGVSPEKARLLTEVAAANRFLVATPDSAPEERRRVSLYLGIPYCTSRCIYCSFPSALLPTDEEQIVCLLTAIGQDIQAVVKLLSNFGMQVQTLYIGGGTPTSLPDIYFQALLEQLVRAFDIADLREFTVEAGRPDSISRNKLSWMRQAGVTRISINPQTMKPATLDLIGRRHRPDEILAAMDMARAAGFDKINMDLIAGLPGEGPDDMKASVEQVLAAAPENITVHTLAVKRGAPLYETVAESGLTPAETVRRMVGDTAERVRAAGYHPYYLYRQKNSPGELENVGYTKPGHECIYNVDIIEERRTIIGMGPSAATKVILPQEWRLNSRYFPKDIPTYIHRIQDLAAKREALIASVFAGQGK